MKNYKGNTYPPEAITTKNDEVLSICEVKRMNFWGCNNTHLQFT